MYQVKVEDLSGPLALDGGALVARSGLVRVMDRALRLLFMRPGELLHRPSYGADLRSYRNKPSTPQVLQNLNNSIERGLSLIPEIEKWSVEIETGETLTLSLTLTVSGETFTRRGIKI